MAENTSANGRTVTEPAHQTPVVEQVDVLVAGGGPAGVTAAVAAARCGARVRLIESHGQLGGVWTSGLLSWVLDAGNKDGIMREILGRIDRRAEMVGLSRWSSGGGVPYDPEQMKLVLEAACLEAGVRVRLHTQVVAAARDADNRLAVAITESKSGREAFAATVFVDATGDGDLAAHAGCGFAIGRPDGDAGGEAGETQPMTLMCLITGIDREATREFHERRDRPWSAPKDALLAEFRRAGVEPSYGRPTIFEIAPDLYAWMINHEYGASALDAQAITDATLHARMELHQNIDALRALGGIWSNLRIVTTGSQIGVREARRIRGRYLLTLDDMIAGRSFDDAVCRVTFGIDVHSTRGSRSRGIEGKPAKTQPYDVPYRSLVAADIDGLLLAGRCISGDFYAHSSYRVTGNSVAMGEAAGVAAAVAAETGRPPHALDYAADVRPRQTAMQRQVSADAPVAP